MYVKMITFCLLTCNYLFSFFNQVDQYGVFGKIVYKDTAISLKGKINLIAVIILYTFII